MQRTPTVPPFCNLDATAACHLRRHTVTDGMVAACEVCSRALDAWQCPYAFAIQTGRQGFPRINKKAATVYFVVPVAVVVSTIPRKQLPWGKPQVFVIWKAGPGRFPS